MMIIPELKMPAFVVFNADAKTGLAAIFHFPAPSHFGKGCTSQSFTKVRIVRKNRAVCQPEINRCPFFGDGIGLEIHTAFTKVQYGAFKDFMFIKSAV
jgi:hypothetical protein